MTRIDPLVEQSDTPVCGDCGESLDRHCTVWPQEGDPFLQCQTARPKGTPQAIRSRCCCSPGYDSWECPTHGA